MCQSNDIFDDNSNVAYYTFVPDNTPIKLDNIHNQFIEIKEQKDTSGESNTDRIFDDVLQEIFSKENAKDKSVDSAHQTQTILAEYMQFIYNGSEITRSYHFSIMKQAQILLVVFTALFTLSTLFLLTVIGIIIFTMVSFSEFLIPLISGAITDIFSGILILVMKNLLKSRDDYFKESVKSEHFSKIVGLIQTIKSEDEKTKLINIIIEDYCGNNKTPHS